MSGTVDETEHLENDSKMMIDEKEMGSRMEASNGMNESSPSSPDDNEGCLQIQSPPESARSPPNDAFETSRSPSGSASESCQSPIRESAQSPALEASDSSQSPSLHVFESAQSPAPDSAQSPTYDAAESAQSPSHQPFGFGTSSARSPALEVSDSAQSPTHDAFETTNSPSQAASMYETCESAESPARESSLSAQSPIPESTHTPSQPIQESAQSPAHDTSESATSPSPHAFGASQSPVRETTESAQSPVHQPPESAQSPPYEGPGFPETASQQTMLESVESPTHETVHAIQSPSHQLRMEEGDSQTSKQDASDSDEMEVDLEDGEIEDGEIEDDEDAPMVVKEVKPVPTMIVARKLETLPAPIERRKKSKRSRSRERKEARDKENKKKKRHHTTDEGHGLDKPGRGKRTRKSQEDDGLLADEDDYLFVRGGSPAEPSPERTKFFEGDLDPFGRPVVYDEPEPGFDRKKRSRSPNQHPDRRRNTGGRRAGSERKAFIKPTHKSDQICAYYMQGKCQKSHEECGFSHNAVPPRKMELCKFWMMECCAKKEKCLYLHNDFPCKFYHTGLVCKLGLRNQCKFSHKPLNEVTKAVLLKHIETAPKEILGDFPRLNRNGALNLIAKMESKINGELERQERAEQAESERKRKASASSAKERDDEHRRRTRWEQPTRDDDAKLHTLMEEAGIANYYEEAVSETQGPTPPHKNKPSQNQGQNHNNSNNGNPNLSMLGVPPPSMLGLGNIGMLPNQLPSMIPGQTQIVHNPALANVLAHLQIPSTTIHLPRDNENEEGHVSQYQKLGKTPPRDLHHQSSPQSRSRRSPTPPLVVLKQEEPNTEPPEHLPPLQKELFRRIQEQQIKSEMKSEKESDSDEEKADDRGWYSSDEESDKPITDVLKNMDKPKVKQEVKPEVDFTSVLSAIRQQSAAAQSKESGDKKLSLDSIKEPSPPRGRGDVDLRYTGQTSSGSAGPFGDTDFRLPPLRPDFKDIDLRVGGSPGSSDVGRNSPAAPVFKSMPTGPATMIDAAVNSHPPMTWKVRMVAGVRKPDYNYIRHTLSQSQLALDPRFGARTAGGISILPDPSSPPPITTTSTASKSPATIPGGDLDPRMRRGQGQQAQQPHGDPRFGRDPRAGGQQAQQKQQGMLPGGPAWPMNDMNQVQAALASQFMAAQAQLGMPLLPFPNAQGLPFAPPDFSSMPGSGRPPFQQGPNPFGSVRPPASSWERYSQQNQPGRGVTPPL